MVELFHRPFLLNNWVRSVDDYKIIGKRLVVVIYTALLYCLHSMIVYFILIDARRPSGRPQQIVDATTGKRKKAAASIVGASCDNKIKNNNNSNKSRR